MTNQTHTLDQLLQSILNDIESNMPTVLSPKVFHPIKEEPLSDDNKENIPPTPEPFNVRGLSVQPYLGLSKCLAILYSM